MLINTQRGFIFIRIKVCLCVFICELTPLNILFPVKNILTFYNKFKGLWTKIFECKTYFNPFILNFQISTYSLKTL